ncbi:unnamed protein product [Moneuplotes crassus]|uniref:Uncharacterized protein n=1 Tax=Euplotes crassus TaxID=5936 RepID=A0AAD2D5W4_EUPCR|nr:unnamed protein product [Moneuplotes crassus]
MPKKATTVRPANKRRSKKHIKRRQNKMRNLKREVYDRSTAKEIIDSIDLPKLKTKVRRLGMLKHLDGQIKSLKDEYDPTIKALNEDETKYLKKLVKKYGDLETGDTFGMFRDIKLNYLQWSEGEIKRKLAIYFQNNSSV